MKVELIVKTSGISIKIAKNNKPGISKIERFKEATSLVNQTNAVHQPSFDVICKKN